MLNASKVNAILPECVWLLCGGSHSNCTLLVEVLPLQEGLGSHTGSTSWKLWRNGSTVLVKYCHGDSIKSNMSDNHTNMSVCSQLSNHSLQHDECGHATVNAVRYMIQKRFMVEKLASGEATRQRGGGQVGGWGAHIHFNLSIAAVQARLCGA